MWSAMADNQKRSAGLTHRENWLLYHLKAKFNFWYKDRLFAKMLESVFIFMPKKAAAFVIYSNLLLRLFIVYKK